MGFRGWSGSLDSLQSIGSDSAMKLSEAYPILQQACNTPFNELFEDKPDDLVTNKGHVGQLLLKYIGVGLDSELTDFDDGELKTNKAKPSGEPMETMFITQVSQIIDELVSQPPKRFEQSNLYIKIRNLLYLPVVKESDDNGHWYFTHCYHIQVDPGTMVFEKLKEDYYSICDGLRENIISRDGFIHTSNGVNGYIQIRSKDSKPYHPIYSTEFGRRVSDKNHAFYFKKDFMKDVIKGAI